MWFIIIALWAWFAYKVNYRTTYLRNADDMYRLASEAKSSHDYHRVAYMNEKFVTDRPPYGSATLAILGILLSAATLAVAFMW